MNHEPCKIEEIDLRFDQKTYFGYLIEEKHSYEDIARFIIDRGWEDDLMALLSNHEFVKSAKGK